MTLVNGQPATVVAVEDRGFQYGDGVFETIAKCKGVLAFWDQHMQRLSCGCQRLGIAQPDVKLLHAEAYEVSEDNDTCVVKIVITRGSSSRGYQIPDTNQLTRVVYAYPWPEYPDHYYKKGIHVKICKTRLARNPALAGIKHLNRLEQVLARSEWQNEYQEGLLMDINDLVIEGTMSNVFIESHGKLLTPDLSQAGVSGIMRQQILNCAAQLAIPYKICDINLEDVENADSAFFCNSVIGIWSVHTIENYLYSNSDIVQQLRDTLNEKQSEIHVS